MTPSISQLAPSTRERLRRRLVQHRRILLMLLAEIRSGKDRMAVLQALGMLRPGVRPDETLSDALEQIERCRLLLISDDARYGRCETCGAGLDTATLEEMPWSDRCPAHAA